MTQKGIRKNINFLERKWEYLIKSGNLHDIYWTKMKEIPEIKEYIRNKKLEQLL